MAKKVALINMKGGVGKSTLAANLACYMAFGPRSLNVLVIDLDPQFNCSQYLIGHNRIEEIWEGQPTVWNIFEQLTEAPNQVDVPFEPSQTVVTVYRSRHNESSVCLIPSTLNLSQTLLTPTSGKEQLLKRAVEELEDEFDLIIVDCAPTESILTRAAYLVADSLLIPVRPEFLSSIGLPLLEQSLSRFERIYREETPTVLGIVFNAIANYSPEESHSKYEVNQIASANNWTVFHREIRFSRSFSTSARRGLPLFATPQTHQVVKNNFYRFAVEFAERTGL